MTVLSAKGLSKSFRSGGSLRQLFHALSLSLGAGQILGLSGPSGCGKTTLGNILLGILPPDDGTVFWEGRATASIPGNEMRTLRPRFQKVHQDPGASFPPRTTLRRYFKDLYRWGGHAPLSEEYWWDSLQSGMKRASLQEKLLDRRPSQLSGGELQRFAILRAMQFSPVFLMADEPTSRLDTSVQAKTARFLAEEAEREGMAVLFISHDEALLRNICGGILSLEG